MEIDGTKVEQHVEQVWGRLDEEKEQPQTYTVSTCLSDLPKRMVQWSFFYYNIDIWRVYNPVITRGDMDIDPKNLEQTSQESSDSYCTSSTGGWIFWGILKIFNFNPIF